MIPWVNLDLRQKQTVKFVLVHRVCSDWWLPTERRFGPDLGVLLRKRKIGLKLTWHELGLTEVCIHPTGSADHSNTLPREQ